jgi:hypothetical protein
MNKVINLKPVNNTNSNNIESLFEINKQLIASKSKKYPVDFSSKSFEYIVNFLLSKGPQSYGKKFESILANWMNFQEVNSRYGIGDLERNNSFFEVKFSMLTGDQKQFNFNQIRNWEDTSGYILIGLDLREYYSSPVRDINNAKFYIFLLTKSEMSYELQSVGQNSHGNAEINKENKHVSKSIKLKCDSSNDTFRYFFKKYLVSEELFFDNSVINRNNIPCVKKFDKVTIKEIYNSQKDIEEELDNLIERQVFLNNLLEEQKYNNLLKYLLERVLLPEIDLNLDYLSEFEEKLVA